MKNHGLMMRSLALATGSIAAMAALAQAPSSTQPADPWPRQMALSNAAVTIYQPQVESWDGNQIQLRAAVSIKPAGAPAPSFGAVFASARTEVDRVARTVVFNDLAITKSNFPTLPDQGVAYAAELKAKLGAATRTISLDRVEASLKAAGVKAPSFPVLNEPPRIIVSNTPAILVPIDGAPVIKPVPDDSRFSRVINTRALMLQGGLGDSWYLHVYDGWLSANSLDGPWSQARRAPIGMDDVAKKLAAAGLVDMLDGGPNANPKPSLANGVPTLYVSQVPTELIVFKGTPNFQPIAGTLLWATNTGADVFIDTNNNDYYVLLSGRWFRAAGTNGPWSFVASNALPPDFAHIPLNSPAAVVLAAVSGTPQAQEAVIANSIPQTATVPLVGGPTFVPSFDGPPQFQPIAGTTLTATTNASVPIIQVEPNAYYTVSSGVWFTAPAVGGPWAVATSVPAVIYTIPPSSVAHFMTYVRIYGATPQMVYVGYTPGYMGTVVGPYGTVVYGTGYTYSPWVGSVWYPPPYTYGVAAVPVYNPAVGFAYGMAVGLATAAWVTPYYGAAYHPYACCGSASASVYGQYGNTAYSGTKTAYASGGVAGVSGSGSHYNKSTGGSGNYATNKSYNAYTGQARQSGAVSGTTGAGGNYNAAASRSYNTYTGQRSASSDVSATGAGGSSIDHTGATTAGPQGYDHTGSTTTTNAKTGETKTWGSSPSGGSRFSGFSREGGGGFRGRR
jgi:hypothetical protein